jgi:hypothetical protein
MNDIRAKRVRELKVIVLGVILFAILLGAYRNNNPAGESSATEASKSQTKKLSEEIQDPVFAKIFVEQYLRNSLRDPDSLVIENITRFNHQFRNGRGYYAGTVQYRAKNGFGGYNRERAIILIDAYNENDIRMVRQ